jgi:hypothetical protein
MIFAMFVMAMKFHFEGAGLTGIDASSLDE